MVSRLPRLWQPGSPQTRVFLPDFWVAVLESPSVGRNRLPKNCVKFEVDPRMSRHDIREYLTKIYHLPVRDVRTEVQMGQMEYSTPADYRYRKAIWKEDDKKYAYVFMPKDFKFYFPSVFDEMTEYAELEKVKEQQAKVKQNAAFANRDRVGVGEMLP